MLPLLTSGGLIFSGDRLSALHPANQSVLETLLRDNPQPARDRQGQLFWPDDPTEWSCAEDSLIVKLAGNGATVLSGKVR